MKFDKNNIRRVFTQNELNVYLNTMDSDYEEKQESIYYKKFDDSLVVEDVIKDYIDNNVDDLIKSITFIHNYRNCYDYGSEVFYNFYENGADEEYLKKLNQKQLDTIHELYETLSSMDIATIDIEYTDNDSARHIYQIDLYRILE